MSEIADCRIVPVDEAPFDRPVEGLGRHRFEGEEALLANVVLEPGCVVPVHQHESEQIAYVLSGKVKWILGEERREQIVEGGTVLILPPHFPHGVVAIERTHIIDILAPKGPMGVDQPRE
jgi:quercetin dioxygenase-like cupin family protein